MNTWNRSISSHFHITLALFSASLLSAAHPGQAQDTKPLPCNLRALIHLRATTPSSPARTLQEATLLKDAGCLQEAIWHLRRQGPHSDIADAWTRSLVTHMTETRVDWTHAKNRDWSKTASAVKFRLNLETPSPALGLELKHETPATAGIFKPEDGGEILAGRAFRQNPEFEVAGYQLSEYLRAYLVPVTVMRQVEGLKVSADGRERQMNAHGNETYGSYQYFLQGSVDGGQGRPSELGGPLLMPGKIRIFNELLRDMDRESNNKNWMIQFGATPFESEVVIDNNLAFNRNSGFFDEARLRKLVQSGSMDPAFEAGIRNATLDGLKRAMQDSEGRCLLGSTLKRDSSRLKALWQRIRKLQAIVAKKP
jgi:hypothetical protein